MAQFGHLSAEAGGVDRSETEHGPNDGGALLDEFAARGEQVTEHLGGNPGRAEALVQAAVVAPRGFKDGTRDAVAEQFRRLRTRLQPPQCSPCATGTSRSAALGAEEYKPAAAEAAMGLPR